MSERESEPLVDVVRVSFAYPNQTAPALSEVDLQLWPGQAVGLLGPNGSGKTTLVSLIAGLRQPSTGQVSYRSEGGVRVAYVPQDFAFYPDLTCRENLDFFAGMSVSGPARARRVEAAMADCQLDEFADRRARHCSGGMKRRLNLAIALLQEPSVLLLDEPTVGVDPQTRAFLLERIAERVRSGTAVLYASHYMEEVSTLCSKILLLDHGRVITRGGLETLLEGDGHVAFANLEALFMYHTHRSLRA